MKNLKKICRWLRKKHKRYIAINSRSYKIYIHNKVSTPQYVTIFRYLQQWQDAGLIITIDRTTADIGDSVAIVRCFDLDKLKYEKKLNSHDFDTNSPTGFFKTL